MLPITAASQESVVPTIKEETADNWRPPDIIDLPAEWWSNLNTDSAQISTDRMNQFLQALDARVNALAGEDLLTAQNSLNSVKTQFELLTVARQGPQAEQFEPVPARETYELDDLLELRARWRNLTQTEARIKLQIEQAESQFRRLQERRDNLLRQYNAADPESPERILLGISRVTARVEYQLAQSGTENLEQKLRQFEQQDQLLSEQEVYARGHLVSALEALTKAESEVVKAREEVASTSDKVSILQSELLDVLSADSVNTSLEILRKQQMTRASAEYALAQLRESLVRAKLNWHRFHGKVLPFDFDFQSSAADARRLSNDALKQAELWSSISQSTLIAAAPGTELNTVKNFEIAQSVARETLGFLNQIGSVSDDLLLVQDVLSTEIIASQSGLHKAWARIGLAAGNIWDRLVELGDFSLFEIGDSPVTPSGLFKMLLVLLLAVGISWLIRFLLSRSVSSDNVSRQAAVYTLGRLLHYIIVLVGVFAALGSIGIDFTSFALIAGALSVGIGFGLQAIVNNFVSGLILLFEGTLRVGDYVELDSGLAGVVREINTRATIVNTNDSVDVVVPNSVLVTTQLTNWTLRETYGRMRVSFGVAYGTDKELVKNLALEAVKKVECALTHMPDREPQIRLVNFGDNALEFTVLFWVSRQGVRRPGRTRATFMWELETLLTENGVEIPFPQRDIHFKSDFRSLQDPGADPDTSET